jgi:hypothetical protein
MSYVSDGTFRKKLESFFGPLVAQSEVEEREAWVDEELSLLPAELSPEINALYELHRQFVVPELCMWGVFNCCTWPALYSMDEDEVREEEFFKEEVDVQRALTNVTLYNNAFGTYVTVGSEGVLHLSEDPHGFEPLCDDLSTFLDVVLHLEAAKQGKFSAETADAMVKSSLHKEDDEEYPLFIQNTLEDAREKAGA